MRSSPFLRGLVAALGLVSVMSGAIAGEPVPVPPTSTVAPAAHATVFTSEFRKGLFNYLSTKTAASAQELEEYGLVVPPDQIDTSQAAEKERLTKQISVTGAAPTSTTYCIPAGTWLSAWDDKDTKEGRYKFIQVDQATSQCPGGSNPHKIVEPYEYYKVSALLLDSAGPSSRFVMGALAIPFKWYFKGDNSVVSNVTGAGYVGIYHHSDWFDVNMTPALFGGLTNVQIPSAAGTSNSTTSQPAFSYGIGLLFSGGDGTGIQGGVAIGRDIVPDNVKWVNNRRGWLSFEVGYAWR